MKFLIFLSSLAVVTLAQNQQQTTPVPILKQINRHNEDGSYSYGYEAADGSFKIETKYATGEVQGKYGYVDDTGKLREIEYGASKRGFEPQGTDINVPPPTLNNNNVVYPTLGANEEDDGQYREDPSIYYKDNRYNTKPAAAPIRQPAYVAPRQQSYTPGPQQYFRSNIAPTAAPAPIEPEPVYQSQPQHRFRYEADPQPQYQQQYEPQPQYQQQPQYQYQPQAQARASYQQTPNSYYHQNQQTNSFLGHPATNFDINTGSYSLTYTG